MPIRLRLYPPAGFLEAANFRGYEQPSTGAEIRVQEIPGPYSEVEAGFTEARLHENGMCLVERRDLSGNGEPRLLLRVEQPVGEQVLDKWIALLGNEHESVVATAFCRREVSAAVLPLLEQALLSLEHIPSLSEPTALKATFPGTDLQLAREIGTTMIFTRDGQFPCPDRCEPICVLDVVPAPSDPSNLRDYAAVRITRVVGTKEVRFDSAAPVTIDGMQGLELVATAEDTASGQPLLLYQVVLHCGASFCVMLGVAGAEFRSSYMPVFRRLAESIQRTNHPSVSSSKRSVLQDRFVAD